MEKSAKTDNFLKAIKKYADEQRRSIRDEAEHLKETKLKEAEAKGKADSEKYVADMLEKKRNEETGKIAKLTQEGQKRLFLERRDMTEQIFSRAEEKLVEYTKTKEYAEKLKKSAAEMASFFGGDGCIIKIKPDDMDKAGELEAIFGEKAEIQADKTVKLGGIKGYCPDKRIVADDTLDSKLAGQRQWFVENSGLKVL